MSEPLLFVHVAISLMGIGTGFVAIAGMPINRRMDFLTAIFLQTTTLTSVSGFFLLADTP